MSLFGKKKKADTSGGGNVQFGVRNDPKLPKRDAVDTAARERSRENEARKD